jgi:prepilin-type N-terminal cleavage/methylation domain-containing protein
MRARNVTRFQNGFNLVEVIIAMAILSSVLLSIITLFFLGRANVYSGKQLTRATAATVHANEDVQAMAPRDLFNAFGPIVPATPMANNTVAGVSYASSLVFTTAQAGSAADVKGYLTRWANLLPAANILNGKVSIIIMPQDLVTSADPTTAQLIQVRLVTEWQEGSRYRNMVLDSSKLNRF